MNKHIIIPESCREPGESSGMGRRNFLTRAPLLVGGAAALVGGALGMASARAGEGPGPASSPSNYDPQQHDYLYLVDINKCIGCGACVRACEAENQVPPHRFRTWIERYMVSPTGEVRIDSPNGARDGFLPEVTGEDVSKGFFVPKICNHCTFTPCVQLCPVGASYRTPDGVVLVDERRCIGCGYCVQACPYGSRFIHPATHTASKCTFCYHRITRGLLPACVQNCPTGARRFGDRKQIDDPVSRIVATETVRVLKPELLTDPNCFYLGMGLEVR